MSKQKSRFKKIFLLTLSLLFVMVFNNCHEDDDYILPESVFNGDYLPWEDFIYQIDFSSGIIIVQKSESLQAAIDAAQPDDVIYLEPGFNINSKSNSIKTNETNIHIVDLGNINDTNNSNTFSNKASKHSKGNYIRNFSRVDLGGGIAHYKVEIAIGNGEYEWIRIHRVVRESNPYHPVATKGNIFMIHGANQDFETIFLTAGASDINANTSSPFYLASNDIDVWGIDMSWTRVPSEGIDDFSFMKDWDMNRDIDHTLKAVSIARLLRGLSNQSFSRMNALGFSYSVKVIYGAANNETQEHPISRDLSGIIPVDSSFKTDPPNCADVDQFKDMLNKGSYYNPWLDMFPPMGDLALNRPDENDLDENLTNSQFLEFIGSQGFFAGENGKFLYTDPVRFFELAIDLSLRMPTKIWLDFSSVSCDTEDVTFDDYLEEISIPILYIGANNDLGSYTPSLTASTDITIQVVDGYGHADLWMAYDADKDVWSDLRRWLVAHK